MVPVTDMVWRSSLALSPNKGAATAILSIARKSVKSANELLYDMENDLIDAKDIIVKRNQHSQNLEELAWLLRQENEDLKVVAHRFDDQQLKFLKESAFELDRRPFVCDGQLQAARTRSPLTVRRK